MITIISPIAYVIALLVGMSVCLAIGRRIGINWRTNAEGRSPSFGAIDGAVFALYGLLVAFTFSSAPARLEKRAYIGADEVNAIGTAYLRLDLLRPDLQPAIRQKFRDYVDSRIATYRLLPDIDAAEKELAISADLQKQIWSETINASEEPGSSPDAAKLLVEALNTMIDITNTRTMAAIIHPPRIIFGMLLLLAYVTSALVGFNMAGTKHSWLHTGAFVLMTVITVFAILQMEYPRLGLLETDQYDRLFTDLRASMN